MKGVFGKEIILIALAILLVPVTFYVFGVELPLYLLLATGGLLAYAYSKDPVVKFVGGFIGRLCATLFIISLIYYLGTRSLFPDNPFTFKFALIGIQFAIEFVGMISNFIGEWVLKLIDIIIP